ncbi:hypothetical protein AB0D90_14595 [Streptomyces althioticus]|uniref:hypothetical protein n=1 Tax=Streptomyces althioticus TaxID=83380 RepID=UPI00340694AF
MPSYDDDYVDLLADQLGVRATARPDLADELEQRPLAEAPLELDRSVSTARWRTEGAAPPDPPDDPA